MANQEAKNCQNCKNQFIIEPDDFGFYTQMKVPAPTFCPQCRMIRRLAVRNERSLYKRQCDLCKKEVVSTYSPDKKLRTYCPECYKSDKWDPRDYGRDYDFSRPLFSQLDELFRDVPRPTLKTRNAINCEYCEDGGDSKNCYLCFGPYLSEDCLYSYSPVASRSCVDTTVAYRSERAYETSDCDGLYNTMFALISDETLDSAFIADCIGCSDCFGCTNLRRKKYYIFNKPYTKAEYLEERVKWDLGSYKKLCEAKEKFNELYYATPRRYAIITNAVGCVGDHISNAKNCIYCFGIIDGAENLKYVQLAGLAAKDSYDSWAFGAQSQFAYEDTGGLRIENVAFSNRIHNSLDIRYCDSCFDSAHLFGCVGLKSKKYMILNKQYTKEEYEKLRAQIIEQAKNIPYVDKAGRQYRYGEYMPIELSGYAYNEALSGEKFPISREQALKNGYQWYDEKPRAYQPTIEPEDLPDHIKDVTDSIFQETIRCAHRGQCDQKCTEVFKIVPKELQFYKQMNVALPRLCPNCRHFEREKMRSPFQLWKRICQCAGRKSEARNTPASPSRVEAGKSETRYQNTAEHAHGENPCGVEFMTAYSPERKEILYCQDCYQTEFL